MTEYLDVLNERGEKTGESFSYDEVHKKGLLHRTIHIYFINSKKQFLLQKRSHNMRAFPNYWDISVAGHISAGEMSAESAQKETREELGLDLSVSEFKFLFTIRPPKFFHQKDFIDNEFNDVYLVRRDVDISVMNLSKEEVNKVQWVDFKDFKKWINGEGELLVPHKEEYQRIFDYLKQ